MAASQAVKTLSQQVSQREKSPESHSNFILKGYRTSKAPIIMIEKPTLNSRQYSAVRPKRNYIITSLKHAVSDDSNDINLAMSPINI